MVKRGDSSNAKDMLILGSDHSLSMSMNKGLAVDKFCEDAAARGEQRVRDLMQGVGNEPRRPWMIQKYIERCVRCRPESAGGEFMRFIGLMRCCKTAGHCSLSRKSFT